MINQEKQRIGKEIMEDYFQFLNHIDDVALERVSEYLYIDKITGKLFISHKHSNDPILERDISQKK